MEAISPAEMLPMLHSLFPETIRAQLRWADQDMLRTLYRENCDHPKAHEIQLAMDTAIANWSDDQVADFVLNHLLQPPQSTDLQSRPVAELRQVLVAVYNYLFLE